MSTQLQIGQHFIVTQPAQKKLTFLLALRPLPRVPWPDPTYSNEITFKYIRHKRDTPHWTKLSDYLGMTRFVTL